MELATPIDQAFRLNPLQKMGLKKLQLETVGDLLFYFPSRYEEPGEFRNIQELKEGDDAVVYGQVSGGKTSKAFHKKIPMSEIMVEDNTGKIKAVWFHQAYMAKKIPDGGWGEFRGKVTNRNGELYLANPDVREGQNWQAGKDSLFTTDDQTTTNLLVSIYPETRGLSSGWFYYHLQKILRTKVQEQLIDPIPAEILHRYNLPSLHTALYWIHCPRRREDAEMAKKRFAFQEIFFIQLGRIRDKINYQNNPSFKLKPTPAALKDFTSRFPFETTASQKKGIAEILKDFDSDKPMTRLLEGDVGSGKTAVAAVTAFAAVNAGFEVAYMVPTEILARQHFESFIKNFSHLSHVQVGLITGSECRKFPSKINKENHTHISKTTLLKWVANGEIPILIGTHSLIQKTVKFKNLAYVIIDEQHRFGVMQRAKLTRKEKGQSVERVPHLLSMTATPIPRTLALTIYGDLDLTLLTEMPHGRKPIITEIIAPDKRDETYEKVRAELRAGRQVFVVCPRIDEPDPTKEMALNVKSAKAESERLAKNIFPEYRVGLLHSKLGPKEKEETMTEFVAGKIEILVATSVVEVGVNVPNATVILIEGAERFGLAQLHQLRGRVIRSNHQAYCFVFTSTKNSKSFARLKALKTAKNGFELAEHDLALRGAGLLNGGRQWGISDIGMEAIKNIKMVEAARTEARRILENDFDLKKYPLIRKKLAERTKEIHFE